MKLILQSHHTRYPLAVARLLEGRLLALGARCGAEEAVFTLSDDPEASPRYRAAVYVRRPGPDLQAAGRDHTVATAVGKALRELEARLADREVRRRERWRDDRPHRAAGGAVRSR